MVSRVGLGLAALGRPGYINLGHAADLPAGHAVADMEARANQVLDAAWSAGVRYFDAARSYGRAEAFLGSWLRSRTVPDAVVGSKWGYTYTAAWRIEAEAHEVKEHSLDVLNRQIAESREQLGTALLLYQIHSATRESGVLRNEAVVHRLAELRAGGLAIGLSVSGPQQAETILEALAVRVNGQPLFDTVQATWNLLETSAGSALARAHEAGLGVLVKEALANGRLTARNSAREFTAHRRVLEQMAGERGVAIDALALAGALAQPWADVVLSGAANAEHLRSNLRALEVRLSPAELEQLRPLAESVADYWRTRGALPWN